MAGGALGYVQNLIKGSPDIADSPEALQQAISGLLKEAAVQASAGESAGSVDLAVSGAEGLSAFAGLGVLAIVILGLLWFRLLERILVGMAKKIPWVGNNVLVPWIHATFWPFDAIENWVMAAAQKQARNAWWGIRSFLQYQLGISLQAQSAGKSPVTQAEIQHLNSRIDNTNARIDAINARLGKLEHSTVGLPAANPVNIKPLQETVKEQGWAIQKLFDNQTNLYGNDQTLLHNQRVLRADLVKLQGQLGGVRTVQTGWIDIVEQIQDLESKLDSRVAANTADIGTLNHRVTNLSPLTLLLQPGLRGLQNLRKLEDKPCQCPQMRFLRPQNIEALAIELAIANGV